MHPPIELPESCSMELTSIPAARFVLRVAHRVREGRCPIYDHGPREVRLRAFALSRLPVTNDQYAAFLSATGYGPDDARNFLRNWQAGRPPAGEGDRPVTWVSPRDAEAFASWAGLRLPTDEEWHWGALGGGCLDMVGHVWEWSAPEYDDGWHRWRFLRGGSPFAAQGSRWYTDGGAQPVASHLRFLLQGEGLNRCATVGFRCAGDLVQEEEAP